MEIIDILKLKHEKTGGHCGTYPVEIKHKTGKSIEDVKLELNKLYKENKITVHDGIHGKMVKLKTK